MNIDLVPIGIVKNNITDLKREDRQTVVSEIIINDDLKQALDQIERFSHIIVIYWMHKTSQPQRSITKVHPRGDQDLPLVGIFGTRSPARTNPIGIATVKLLEHRGNVLKVRGLDAVNGTPVLDIKPHIPGSDSPGGAKTPEWLTTNTLCKHLSLSPIEDTEHL